MIDLPAGWVEAKVADLALSLQNGIYRSRECYDDSGVPCLRMYNIHHGRIVLHDLKRMLLSRMEVDQYRLLPGDILVNRVNSRELVGKAAVIPEGLGDAVYESKNIRLRVDPRAVNPTYLSYHFLHSASRHFSQNAQQTVGMASINQTQLSAFPLPLAPRAEQDRIVSEIDKHFSRLDAAVAALKRAQANLTRYRAAVVGTLDYSPHGNENNTATLGALCDVQVGFAFRSQEFVGEGIRLLRGENIEPGALRWTETRCWPVDRVAAFRHLLVAEGDIILAMDRPVVSSGLKLARARKADLPCLLVQRVARLRPYNPQHSLLILRLLEGGRFLRHLFAGQTGTQLPHISAATIRSFHVATPLENLHGEAAVVDAVLSRSEESEREIGIQLRRAVLLRKAILTSAFSGRLVPQDPHDEPASALLDRIRAERGSTPTRKPTARRRPELAAV